MRTRKSSFSFLFKELVFGGKHRLLGEGVVIEHYVSEAHVLRAVNVVWDLDTVGFEVLDIYAFDCVIVLSVDIDAVVIDQM